MGRALLLGLAALALAACERETESEWVQFNRGSNEVTIQVGAADLMDPEETLLYSSSGQVEIGLGIVDPAGGPVGTEHEFVVAVDEDFAAMVGRATVRLDSGALGEDEYEMVPDSAQMGIFTIVLVSVGEEGEERTDTATFRLWNDAADGQDGEDE